MKSSNCTRSLERTIDVGAEEKQKKKQTKNRCAYSACGNKRFHYSTWYEVMGGRIWLAISRIFMHALNQMILLWRQ